MTESDLLRKCVETKGKTRELIWTNIFKYLLVFSLNFHSQGKAGKAFFIPDIIMN
jgi:hypothetical protein